ncbi:MAG: FIST N-terminal domain-containing protein [bacterium]
MIQAGVGQSKNNDSKKAGQEAYQMALSQIAGEKPELVLVFASSKFDQKQLLDSIKSETEKIPVVGCSTSGEITNQGPNKESVAVMAIRADNIDFAVGLGKGVKENSRQAGKQTAEDVQKKLAGKPSMFIMLPDGLTGNGAEIVRGILDVLGEHFPLMGGSAGDDFKFEKTFEYYEGEVFNDAVVGIGMTGKFAWGVGVRHGWEPIGLPMKVTKSEGAVLKELDNKPALRIYEDYFGKKAEELIREPIARMAYTYPLGMSVEGSPELLIRDVVIANEKGEITCAAEIPQGSEIRLMLGDPEKAINSAREAAENAKSQLKGAKPKAIFVFDCIARCKLLGQGIRTKEEVDAIQEILGKDVPLIGFYTYGEQAPLGGNIDPQVCQAVFHNETMALLVIGEYD